MKILIAAGGTLGHLNPSFVIADELKKRGHEVYYVSLIKNKSKKFFEYSDVLYVDIKSLDRIRLHRNIKNYYLNKKSKKKIRSFIEYINPDLVISFGASVGCLTIKAIKNKKIIKVMHEQNAIMGLGNRLVYNKVQKVLLTLECDKPGTIVGNPVITDFYEKYKNCNANYKNILIVCGTNGASKINDFFIDNYKALNEYNITIITGKKYYSDNIEKINKINNSKFIIKDFADNIINDYQNVGIVICRSGSGTLSELMGMRKLALTIPSPNVSNNHQYHNAKKYYDLGCVEMIKEEELSIERIKEKISLLIKNKNKYLDNIEKTQNVYSKYIFIDIIEGMFSEEQYG